MQLKKTDTNRKKKFDVIVHVAGEQILPLYMAVEQFVCDRHIVLTTSRTEFTFQRLQHYYTSAGKRFESVRITPYQLGADTVKRIIAAVEEQTGATAVGFNLTGGTKPMFAVTFAACQKIGGIPFYIETTGKTVDYLAGDFGKEDLIPSLSIDACVALTGHTVRDSGYWDDDPKREQTRKLSNFLWKNSRAIASIYKLINAYTDKPSIPFLEQNEEGNVIAQLDEAGTAQLQIGRHVQKFHDFPDFAAFLCGGWFEQYCYQRLEPLLRNGQIKDMRIGYVPGWENGDIDRDAQEFDLVATDGYNLTIAECKAGYTRQEHLQKLENNVKRYGGAFGRGVLLSVFPLSSNQTALQRIQDSDCVSAVVAGAIEHDLQNKFFNGKSGQVYSMRFGGR